MTDASAGSAARRRGSARVLAAIPNIDALLAARVRQGVGAALADERGEVVLCAPPVGAWTLRLDEGRVALSRGRSRHPRATVTADPATWANVLEGRYSGIEAFLDHGLVVRGDLALALQLDGAFDVGQRPVTHPVARVVTAGGVRSAYLEAGPRDAPAVLLLHGLGGTNASLLPLLMDLARDHRVISPDFPGFGASAAPRWRYSAPELAHWLMSFCRAVGVTRTSIVGNSLGGRVAIEAALAQPQSIERMVLLCPSPAFLRMRQFVPLVRLLPPSAVIRQVPLPHRLVVASIRLMFAQPDRLPGPWYDAAADEFMRVMASYAHRRAFYSAMKEIYVEAAYGEHGFWDRLPRLDVPTLFVWGSHDRLVPASFERHVVGAVPEAQTVVLDECGHVPQFELPELTCQLTREFLDR